VLLALDIGNSHIVAGVFNGEKLIHTWRIATDDLKTGDEYSIILRSLLEQNGCTVADIEGCVIGNVVPSLQEPFEQACAALFDLAPLSVHAGVDTGVGVRMDFPMEVGADRLANAAAALKLYRVPAIIIDFGTGTTFDVVSSDGAFIGGAIAPGIVVAAEALTSRAARLFRVELVVPPRAIGKNTAEAVQSGTMFGYIGLIEGVTRRIARELGDDPIVIATGGLARTVAVHSELVDVIDPDLTLHGLRLIYERNTSGGS